MRIESIPFTTIDWATVAATEEAGATGTALTRTFEMGNVRVRMVEFSPGYSAPDWCSRGHAVLILEGELETKVKDGGSYVQGPGAGILVADGAAPHDPPRPLVRRYSSWIERLQRRARLGR